MKQFIILILLVFPLTTNAQQLDLDSLIIQREKVQEINDLAMIYKCSEDAMEFRWAPTNAVTWKMGNLFGYTLERMSINSDEFLPVGTGKFMPTPENEWPEITEKNKYMAIAAQCIYGKSEVTGFGQKSQDMENRFTFNLLAADFNKEAANASGLYYLEKDTSETSFAVYRIYTFDPVTNESSDTAYLHAKHSVSQDIYPPNLQLEEQDGAIKLVWKGGGQEYSDNKLTAYHIERSTDGKEFTRLNKEPYTMVSTNLRSNTNFTTYIDSVENGIVFQYRVAGLDPFGDQTRPSDIVQGMGIDLTPPSAVSDVNTEVIDNSIIRINWQWADINQQKDLKGFNIYIGNKSEGPFVKFNKSMLGRDVRTFETEKIMQSGFVFFYIEAIDENNNTSNSIVTHGHIVDMIPPGIPTNLTAEIDSSGMVLIQWDAPADDDIKGYELFYANSKNHIFTKQSIPIIQQNFYVDSVTLNTLSQELYYKVVTVDNNYNRSDDSDVFTAMRPDIIPPSASIFKSYLAEEDGITIEWIASNSNDVASIQLMRRISDQDWKIIEEFDRYQTTFIDRKVEGGVIYEYNLVTTDIAGNSSVPQNTLTLEAIKPFFLEDVENLEVSKEGENMVLSWKYDEVSEYDFMIYKTNSNGNLISYKKVEGENTLSIPYARESNHSFAIKAKGQDGRSSKMSETISLK